MKESAESFRKQLLDSGFTFVDSVRWCSDEELRMMDEAWGKSNYLEDNDLDVNLRPGLFIRPDAPVEVDADGNYHLKL